MAGEQQSWSFRTRVVVMLLAGVPAMVAGISTGLALGDWPLGLRVLAILEAGLAMSVVGLLVAWFLLGKRPDQPSGFSGLFSCFLGKANDGGWKVAAGEENGRGMIMCVRTKPPSFARKEDFGHLVGVCWSYGSLNDNGLTSRTDLRRMDELEDLLVPALEGSQQAFLTGVVTRDGMREWHWYARDNEAVTMVVNQTLGDYNFPVQVVWKDDPDWRFAQILLDLVS